MTDRLPLHELTQHDLDELYDELAATRTNLAASQTHTEEALRIAERAEATVARVQAKAAEWRDWNPAEMSWAIRDVENAIANTPPPQPEDPTAALAEPTEA
jgi:hypothetical protein